MNDDFTSRLSKLDAADIAHSIQALYQTAEEVITDETIASRERLIHLRARASDLGARINDRELRQILWKVRRKLAGAAEPIGRGGKLVLTEAPWLWQDLILKGCTNLLVALPKVGKSRLMTMMIGRMVVGEGAFLGRQLQQGAPPVLIVGSDQNQRDWAKCLRLAGLLDDDGTMHNCIVGLFHKGCPLHLDEDGIDQIVSNYCEKYPGLLILLDSYHACTSHLGLEESSASFADPLIDLQEAISPYDATLVVIHHANKNAAGGRASQSSRGSTALPGAVSQTLTMAWAENQDGPMARRDSRVKLTTEGREGEPADLLIEQIDEGRNWVLHGTGEEVVRLQQLEQILDGLTQRQYDALMLMCRYWQQSQEGIDAVQLARALGVKGATPHTKARTVLVSLHRQKLLVDAGFRAASGEAGGQPARLYRPIDELLAISPEMAHLPLEPLVESVTPEPAATKSKRGKTGKTGTFGDAVLHDCEQCGATFTASKRGRTAKYCSGSCRAKASRQRQAMP